MTEREFPCIEYRDSLALMTSGDLSDQELAGVMRHLSDCRGCRVHWQALQDDHRALQSFSRSLQGRIADLERNVIASVLDERPSAPEDMRWWGWIMATNKRRLMTTGAAAAIAVGLFLVLHFATAPFAAWAEVMENARGAASCQFRARNLDNEGVEVVRTYSDLGFSNNTFEEGKLVEKLCVDLATKTAVHLIVPLERGVKMTLGDGMVRMYLEKNPKHLFQRLAEIEHERLGYEKIDGRELVGIRARGHDLVPELMDEAEFTVWADPDTKWPVRIDIVGTSFDGEMRKRVRFYDFQWNLQVPEETFRPEVPATFDMVEGVELEIDEDHAIEGLRDFARVAGGRYPPTLAYEQLTPEMWRIMGRRVLSTKVLPVVHKMRATCEFYGKLVHEDKDPVYFGERVRPGEADRVLMRWRLERDKYRVLFGDLRVDDVDGASLLELEAL